MSSFLRKNGDSLEMNYVHSRVVGSGTREDTAVRQPPKPPPADPAALASAHCREPGLRGDGYRADLSFESLKKNSLLFETHIEKEKQIYLPIHSADVANL